jgi:hypothetical protein
VKIKQTLISAMKKIILCFSLFMGIFTAKAQTTITNSIFLAAGDTLQRSITATTAGVTITPPASNAQSWNMSFLTTDATLLDSVRFASAGVSFSSFPNTEIILPVAGFGQGYVDVDASAMTMVGASIDLMGLTFVSPFVNTQTLQTAPLSYGTSLNDTHSLRFATHVDSVPGLRMLIDQLGLPVSPDSIRLNINGTSELIVDAFGDITLYDSTYTVLRQKVEVINATTIEAYIAAFGSGFWLDVTSTIAGQLPIPLNDTTFRYDFLKEGSKIPVVRINMDGTGTSIRDIEFKGYNENTAINSLELKEITVFPNPANEQITINSTSINEIFNLQIVDAMGRVINKVSNLNDNNVQIDVRTLPVGNFIILLSSEKGKLLAVEKVSIHR